MLCTIWLEQMYCHHIAGLMLERATQIFLKYMVVLFLVGSCPQHSEPFAAYQATFAPCGKYVLLENVSAVAYLAWPSVACLGSFSTGSDHWQ